MKLVKAFQDAAQVAEDAVSVALKFQTLPSAIVAAGKDAVAAVIHWDSASAQRIYDDVLRIRNEVGADSAGASAEFDKLQTSVQALVSDLS